MNRASTRRKTSRTHVLKKTTRALGLDDPLKLLDHDRPKTRREFIGQGFMTGASALMTGSVFSLFANPQQAHAALSGDINSLLTSCGVTNGAGKIPFICFDLAGGANIAGSNVLVGGSGGQRDFLSSAGYSKQGLPGDMVPSITNPDTQTNDFVNTDFGLAFHSDSQMLAGINEKAGLRAASINGAVIAARSENDTGNNPHNPMYAINLAGANGSLLTLAGSRATDSGGNSMAPLDMINPEVRPTKVDRGSDVTGLVDTGSLVGLLSQDDTVAVMEAIYRISKSKLDRVNTGITTDDVVKELVACGYIQSADIADRFGNPSSLNPDVDLDIVGAAGIFSTDEYNNDSEFRKTAAIMKLVVNGFAGAGTVTMGGYDYHTGERGTGERRDLRAGRCIGACLEYAARLGKPIMVYVFSDGSVFSDGTIDNSVEGRGKGVWTGDNQQTAASYFLVYNPNGRALLTGGSAEQQMMQQQIGYMRSSGDVETSSSPAANNVNLLVQTVALNYMALHGEQAGFSSIFGGNLGNASAQDQLIAFEQIVSGSI